MSNVIRRTIKANESPTRQDRPDQVKNNAGGYVYKTSDAKRLRRFLVLGTDGGTYYQNEQDLTDQNLKFIDELIVKNPGLVANIVEGVSVNGLAYRNTPAIYVAARLITLCPDNFKSVAKGVVLSVCRTATHLFQFASFIDAMPDSGWGQAKMSAVAQWYTGKTAEQLAYQCVKYRSRHGYTHRDMLRLSHPKGLDANSADFILNGTAMYSGDLYDGFQKMQAARNENEVIAVLNAFRNLPWETIPTVFLTFPSVWKALFYNGQLNGQALLRNMKRLNGLKAFDDMCFTADVSRRLCDTEMLMKTRLHPMQYLFALGANGALVPAYGWSSYGRTTPHAPLNPQIEGALEDGFYRAFEYADISSARTLIGVDVSGSMGDQIMSSNDRSSGVSCAQASAVMAMAVARRTDAYRIMGFSNEFRQLNISARTSMSSAFKEVHDNNFGGTDCSLPMKWALQNNIEVDTFIVVTDNETWYGGSGNFFRSSGVKPDAALRQYRNKTGINSKLVVVGMTSTGFSIADPKDHGMMDVVGFDASTPRIISDFSNGVI